MADGPFRFQNGAGSFYLSSQSSRPFNQQRSASPAQLQRPSYSTDELHRTHSPSHQQTGSNPYNMYNHNHQTSGNVFMNNGHGGHGRFGLPMSSAKFSNSTHHNQHHGHRQQQQQDHTGHSNFSGHQHNSSSSGFSAGTPHFAPGQLRNGTPGHSQNGLGRPPNEQWAQQLAKYQESRESTATHAHARNSNANKAISSSDLDNGKKDSETLERHRAVVKPEPSESQAWQHLDLGGQGLRALAPPLFRYTFLTKLFLNSNNLSYIPPSIGKLRLLEELDLSQNNIQFLPPEMGMLVNLKQLLLFDNQLHTLPDDLGSLYKLEFLGIEGNPLDDDYRALMMDEGTRAMVTELRERLADLAPPEYDRPWRRIDESRSTAEAEHFTVMSFNTLHDRAATASMYGYTPASVLRWEHRKHTILNELRHRNPDVMCLQEVDQDSYNEFFRPMLAENGYKAFFIPKSRAKTMAEREAKYVDGCVTFWKHNKYVLLDKQHIDLGYTAINRPDMKGEHDIFNRVMPRDNIAIVTFLEHRQSGARMIVVNAHLYWDPAFNDVKLVQSAILLDQVQRIAEQYKNHPPCKDKSLYRYSEVDSPDGDEPAELATPEPSKEYRTATQIPLLICGDFNSLPDSGVYQLFASGDLPPHHPDFESRSYGDFSRHGMQHPFNLKSAYGNMGELPFTNYTPNFAGVISYIWYSPSALQVTSLLGPVDEEYISRVPGFPNAHFPSDHLALMSEFVIKQKKERQITEVDFGPQKSDRK